MDQGLRPSTRQLDETQPGWPEAETLLTLIRKGVRTGRDAPFNIEQGVAGKDSGHFPLEQLIGKGKDTGASMLIIEAVDRDDPRPLWIPIWGGSVELAQALWRVRNDRSAKELETFVAKLRVSKFPKMQWGSHCMCCFCLLTKVLHH